ncbi:hypothetical protein F5884DRAFT_859835 [Xylogone sp. PMI_703]|nr:hypothetical protein F5884DRAFT_859835 [Xylogone sp. PMI_703]
MASPESKYSLVSDSDTENQENDTFLPNFSYKATSRRRIWPWIIHSVLLLTSGILFIITLTRYPKVVGPIDSIEPGWTQEYSEAVNAVGQRFGWQYLGEFGQPSIYRGQPNPDLDAAWEEISDSGVFSVTEEEMARIGKLSNSSVMLPPEAGGNYMASMEAVHQMHCLNLLRKFSYREYYADKSEHFAHPGKFRIHLDHCIEMLRQVIMCNADLHIITYNWVDQVDYAWPNFNLNKQCRDFNAVMGWIHAHEARTKVPDGILRRPPGAATKPIIAAEYVHEGF